MNYVVDVNGERVEAAVEPGAVEIGGERFRTLLAEVEGTPVRLVALGDQVHRVVARRHRERG